MTEDHGYFEVRCALAASGQLTPTEGAELREHAKHCEVCSSRITELNVLGARLLIAHTWKDQSGGLPQGMKERFVRRAIREGVPLSHRTRTTHTDHLGFVAIIVLAVSIFVIAHKSAPLPRPPVDTGRADGSPVSLSRQAGNRKPQEILSNLRPAMGRGGLQGRRGSGVNRRALFAERRAPWSNGPSPANAHSTQYPHFVFTGYSENSTASVLTPPAIAFRAPSRPGGNLLAECEYCAFRAVSQLLWPDKDREVWFSLGENHEEAYRFDLHPLRNSFRLSSLPSGRTFVPPTEQAPHAIFTFGIFKPTPYFKLDQAAFQLVKGVGQ
jgi:hypothetical protein